MLMDLFFVASAVRRKRRAALSRIHGRHPRAAERRAHKMKSGAIANDDPIKLVAAAPRERSNGSLFRRIPTSPTLPTG